MLVIDKRTQTTVPFKDIKAGECFIDHDDELNIKLDVSYYAIGEGHPNAIVLDSAQPWSCDDEEQVIKVRAKVVIEA
jgi:hypothetical protein